MPSTLTKSQQELFDKWYIVYPLHKAPANAEKVWKKISPDEDLFERMFTAIQTQKLERYRKMNRGDFVPDWPYPATWLNGRRWEDEPEIVQSRQERQDQAEASRMMQCPSCRQWKFNSERCSECGFSR